MLHIFRRDWGIQEHSQSRRLEDLESISFDLELGLRSREIEFDLEWISRGSRGDLEPVSESTTMNSGVDSACETDNSKRKQYTEISGSWLMGKTILNVRECCIILL